MQQQATLMEGRTASSSTQQSSNTEAFLIIDEIELRTEL